MGLRWEIKICNGPCSRRRPEDNLDWIHVKQRGAMYKHCAFAPICCIVCCDIFSVPINVFVVVFFCLSLKSSKAVKNTLIDRFPRNLRGNLSI